MGRLVRGDDRTPVVGEGDLARWQVVERPEDHALELLGRHEERLPGDRVLISALLLCQQAFPLLVQLHHHGVERTAQHLTQVVRLGLVDACVAQLAVVEKVPQVELPAVGIERPRILGELVNAVEFSIDPPV